MVFDQDYMGGSTYTYNTAPHSDYDTNAKFIAYMLTLHPQEDNSITFADLMTITVKDETEAYYLDTVKSKMSVGVIQMSTQKSLPTGYPLIRNRSNRWTVPSAEEKIEGFLASPYSVGDDTIDVILADEILIVTNDVGIDVSANPPTMLKWNGSGYATTTDESKAALIGFDAGNTYVTIKNRQ